jgi:deoxyribose-phosphate aldolase
MGTLRTRDLAPLIDLSCVKANHDENEIDEMAAIARAYNVCAVFTLPAHTALLKKLMAGSPVKVGGAVGFPSGSVTTETKLVEVEQLLKLDVDEIDMVVNITWLRSGEYARALHDVRSVVRAAGLLPVKLILEVTYLSEAQIREGCELGIEAGVEFLKSGTGWSSLPTTMEHVRIMADAVKGRCKLKVAGGVRDRETLLNMRELGVSRFGIGTKAAVRILEEAEAADAT